MRTLRDCQICPHRGITRAARGRGGPGAGTNRPHGAQPGHNCPGVTMRKFIAPSILGLSLSLAGTLVPAPARAHFKLNAIDDKMDVSWMSQNAQGAPQKTG